MKVYPKIVSGLRQVVDEVVGPAGQVVFFSQSDTEVK